MGPLFSSVFHSDETFDNYIITSLFSSIWMLPLNGQKDFLIGMWFWPLTYKSQYQHTILVFSISKKCMSIFTFYASIKCIFLLHL